MSEVRVNGVRLAYDVQGEGAPVVLVCGTGMPAMVWSMLATPRLLADGYQVITFDNRGIPPSDVPPPPYTVEEMADDTIGLLEHLDLGPVAMFGASLGGEITQCVALRRPDLVGAAIFMVGVGRASAFGRATITAMIEALEAPEGVPPSILRALMAPSVVPPSLWGDDAAAEARMSMLDVFTSSDPAGFLGQCHATLAWAASEASGDLTGLAMPALAIAAEHCFIFPPAMVRAAVEQMADGRYVELPGAAHIAMDPDSNAIIEEAFSSFLAEHHPARRAPT